MPKCKVCRTPFTPTRPLQPVCADFNCRVTYATIQAEKSRQKRLKVERQEIRKRREKLKTRREYLRETQTAFNAYSRYRDKDKPCISCGNAFKREMDGGDFDCGHYRSVGSAPHLRFDERNAHGQCKQCNRWGAGRAVDYRLGLIKRLGLSVVEALESDQTPRKWTIPELIEIRDTYRRKLKELKSKDAP